MGDVGRQREEPARARPRRSRSHERSHTTALLRSRVGASAGPALARPAGPHVAIHPRTLAFQPAAAAVVHTLTDPVPLRVSFNRGAPPRWATWGASARSRLARAHDDHDRTGARTPPPYCEAAWAPARGRPSRVRRGPTSRLARARSRCQRGAGPRASGGPPRRDSLAHARVTTKPSRRQRPETPTAPTPRGMRAAMSGTRTLRFSYPRRRCGPGPTRCGGRCSSSRRRWGARPTSRARPGRP